MTVGRKTGGYLAIGNSPGVAALHPMTVITGTIRDSGGVGLTGTLTVTLDSPLVDSSVTPSQVLTIEPRSFTVTNGVLSAIDLSESATFNTTYHFEYSVSETETLYYFPDGALYTGVRHQFNGNWYTGPTQTAESELIYASSEERSRLVLDFHAIVPNVATVEFADLVPTGVTSDVLDTSIARLAELLTGNVQYRNALRGGPNWKGAYSAATFYQLDDAVSYAGSSWVWINETPAQGQTPAPGIYWLLLAEKGNPGGTGGQDTAYNATGWDGATWAPTANAVRDIIETLARSSQLGSYAPLASPAFTGAPTAPTPTPGANNTRIATANYVDAAIAAVGTVPIGTVAIWMMGSAPSRWMLCDGRAISRTVYSTLFAMFSTNYGAGDGSTTFNIPDYRGRVAVMIDNSPLQGSAGRLTSNNLMTQSGGSESVVLTKAQLPSGVLEFGTGGAGLAAGSTVQNIGANQAHPNMPPYLICNMIIYTGVL